MIMMMIKDDTSQVVKLMECLTCPVCHNLFSEATTISECLHTFCRHCIYKKMEDEDLDCCPVCNTDLGGAPLDKLRADHNLQDLRSKLFPSVIKKREEAPDAVPSVPLPAKQKERSLSSLVVSSAASSLQPCMTGRRKYPTRKSVVPQQSALPAEKASKKAEDCPKNFSSQETISKVSVNGKQQKSTNESSKQPVPNNTVEDNEKPCEEKAYPLKPSNHLVKTASEKTKANNNKGKADLVKPSNHLVETASENTKANNNTNENPLETVVESVLLEANDQGQRQEAEAKVGRQRRRSRVNGDVKDSTPPQSGPVKRRKTQRRRQRRAAVTPERSTAVAAQNIGNANSELAGRFNPIWFSLIASNQQEGDEPLPQISSCYLRVKDGSLTVSLVKKYLMKKLDLESEAEVEIMLRGQPMISTLQLHNLVDQWIRTAPASESIHTSAGSSGKDVVLVLSYGRKAHPSHRHVKSQ